jgi:hypothetical protein
MIMMPYGWTLDIAAAHRSGRLLAPHRCRWPPREGVCPPAGGPGGAGDLQRTGRPIPARKLSVSCAQVGQGPGMIERGGLGGTEPQRLGEAVITGIPAHDLWGAKSPSGL